MRTITIWGQSAGSNALSVYLSHPDLYPAGGVGVKGAVLMSGGYNPPTNWPQGSAGKHAAGDTRFSARIEPNGSYGTLAAQGGWMFYTYWHDMKQSGLA